MLTLVFFSENIVFICVYNYYLLITAVASRFVLLRVFETLWINIRLSSLGYEAWKAWRTLNLDIFLIIVKLRKGKVLSWLSKIYPDQICHAYRARASSFLDTWIQRYFMNVKFLPFRNFTIIKTISQLNVRHAFQASYPRTIVPQTWHAFKYPSIQKTWDSSSSLVASYSKLDTYKHGTSRRYQLSVSTLGTSLSPRPRKM